MLGKNDFAKQKVFNISQKDKNIVLA